MVLFSGILLVPAHAAFSSLYIFGDALSSTTDNPQIGPLYYGKRYSNGRVWVEVLVQRQGLAYEASKNNSYFDHNSAELAAQINSFPPPPNASTSLFIVWVCNADTFDAAISDPPYNASQWAAANSQAQTNHLQIITNLYARGVRTLILPNAVDISRIPTFNQSPLTNVMRNGCIAYNVAFSNTINQARALRPDLKIYAPDFFGLLNGALTNAAKYGLINVTYNGFSLAATLANQNGFPNAATNGYGTNYIFWDPQNPTAKFHAVMADVVQQLISPVQITAITPFAGSNQLEVVNLPVGLNGFADGVVDMSLTNWTSLKSFPSTNTTQAVFVTSASPQWFYRLRFPYAWSWP